MTNIVIHDENNKELALDLATKIADLLDKNGYIGEIHSCKKGKIISILVEKKPEEDILEENSADAK